MKRVLLYVLAGIVSFMVFIVILAPATALWPLIAPRIPPEIAVSNIQGSIWDGDADLTYAELPTSRIHWTTRPTALLDGTIHLDLAIAGKGHRVNGELSLADQSIVLHNLEGDIEAAYVNQLSSRYALEFSGTLNAGGVSLTSDGRWLRSLEGELHWTGGEVVYTPFGEFQQYDLPALDGRLSLDDQSPHLGIFHGTNPVLDLSVKPDGWSSVAIRANLLELLTPNQPITFTGDEIVFQVEQELW